MCSYARGIAHPLGSRGLASSGTTRAWVVHARAAPATWLMSHLSGWFNGYTADAFRTRTRLSGMKTMLTTSRIVSTLSLCRNLFESPTERPQPARRWGVRGDDVDTAISRLPKG
jgi:hypothetical protein